MHKMTEVEKDSKNKKWKKVLSVVFRCIFFLWILWFVFHNHYKEIYENIRGIHPGILVSILALGASYQMIGGYAFFQLAHKNHPGFTYKEALESAYVSYFGTIAAFSVGALPLRMYYLHRHQINAGNGISLINSDFILHKSAVLVCNTFLLLLAGRGFVKEQPYILKYIIYGYLICFLIILGLILIGFSEKIFTLAKWGISKLPENQKLIRLKEKLLYYLGTMHECGVEMKKNIVNNFKILLIHCVKLLIMYSIPFVCLRAISTKSVPFLEIVMLVGITNLVSSALPNVSGLGSTEVAFLLVFSKIIDGPNVSSTLVLYRIATYFLPFIISCIVFAKVEQNRKKVKK